MLEIDEQVLCQSPKSKGFTAVLQNCGKSAAKHSIGKTTLLYFGHLSTTFCTRL